MQEWPPRGGEESSTEDGPEDGKDLQSVSTVRNKLPRSLSLKKRLEIDSLFAKGKRFSGHFCTVLWQPNPRFQYGVFVPTKFGSASARIRLKRLLREAIRLNRHNLEGVGRIGIVPNSYGKVPHWKEIDSEVRTLFGKITN